ncbi:MAG: IclR family transcriptional regulator [Microbacteriaceae bacterium]
MSSVPAATATLRVLKYLAGHGGPVRGATIGRDLGLPRSTVYHLLRVMQDEGFVIHSPENQAFGLSSLVSAIGSSVLRSTVLGTLAQPILNRLVAETRLPVVAQLGVLQHADVIYALKVSAKRAPAVVTSIGVRLPAHLTATGRAMLSALPAVQLAAVYPPGEELPTRHGPALTPDRLGRMLAETRERGWATENGDIDPEYASVAAVVLDHNGYPAAAIGLTFRDSAVTPDEWGLLGTATSRAAGSLSRRIRGAAHSTTASSP